MIYELIDHFKKKFPFLLVILLIFIQNSVCEELGGNNVWKRYVIDNSSQGADGIRVKDINYDGKLDLVTGWEEGGIIRIYYNPGKFLVKNLWPNETIAEVSSPEDAVFVDFNQDNQYEVISCCEGNERSVFIHSKELEISSELKWKTKAIPVLQDKAAWMFCLPMNIDKQHGNDLILGAKGSEAELGWLQSPKNTSQIDQWKWNPFLPVSWIMSIEAHDMDSDDDLDILVSDRKPDHQTVFWLERPNKNPNQTDRWNVHKINKQSHEFMFLDYGDLDQDGMNDVVVATPKDGILIYRGLDKYGKDWQKFKVLMPSNTGTGKAVRIVDWNNDGQNEIIFSCEHASDKHGVGILTPTKGYWNSEWKFNSISGLEGTKFDLLQLIDLDEDGDLDVLTCEERENLGVIWYENPFIN